MIRRRSQALDVPMYMSIQNVKANEIYEKLFDSEVVFALRGHS